MEISAYSGLISVGPLIEVNPMNVWMTMSPSSVQSGVLSISNVGTDPLTYSIPAALQPPDVTVWPNSGTIAAGDSSYVQYTVNSSSMVLGTRPYDHDQQRGGHCHHCDPQYHGNRA